MGIRDRYWLNPRLHSIDSLIPANYFVSVPLDKLRGMDYAVMTYCWGNEHDKGNYSYWSDMVQSVMPHSRAPYWWIDVLCLPQHDESAKMPTVRRSHKIYENAKEYHIIGYRTLLRGW